MRVVALACVLFCCAAAGASAGSTEVSSSSASESSNAIRDPFASPMLAGDGRGVSPIERFPLDELRLVATVDGTGTPRALIEDPSGLGFITAVGSIVGAERHRILSITSGEVVLQSAPRPGQESARVVLKLGRGTGSGGKALEK